MYLSRSAEAIWIDWSCSIVNGRVTPRLIGPASRQTGQERQQYPSFVAVNANAPAAQRVEHAFVPHGEGKLVLLEGRQRLVRERQVHDAGGLHWLNLDFHTEFKPAASILDQLKLGRELVEQSLPLVLRIEPE